MTAPRVPQPTGGDHADQNAHDHPTGSPEMTTDAFNATAASTPTDAAPRPDQPLDAPLPYGAGFTAPEQFGYGVATEAQQVSSAPTAVARRERPGSPVLAVAGLLSLGVAVWAVLGAPAISTTAVLAAGLVLTVLVGLIMVVRR